MEKNIKSSILSPLNINSNTAVMKCILLIHSHILTII